MLVALSPLMLSAIACYLMLRHDAIPLLQKTMSRRQDEIDPIQDLRLLIWSSATPVQGMVENGNAAQVHTYRTVQERIAQAFVALEPRMQRDPELSELFDKAHQDWIAADSLASKAVAASRGSGDWQLLARFHQRIVAADEKLAAAYEKLTKDAPENQTPAIDLFNRFEKVVPVFAAVSVVAFLVL